MQLNEVLDYLHSIANADNVAGMARFGIKPHNTLGIDIYTLRKIAKGFGTDHALALQVWDSGIHEARILASYIADPQRMSEAQIEQYNRWRIRYTLPFASASPLRCRRLR